MESIVRTGRNVIELYQGFLFQRYNSRGKKGYYMMTEAMIRTCLKCGNRSVGRRASPIAVYGEYRYRRGTALSCIKVFCSKDTIVVAKRGLT